MLLLNTCRRALRRTALASALGAGLLAPSMLSKPLFAQHPAAYQPRLLPTQQARPLDQTGNNNLLPPAPQTGAINAESTYSAATVPGMIQSTAAARTAQQRPNQQQQPQQMELAQYVDPVQKPGLFSRMFRALRKDSAIPAGPPQDPGMSYPIGGAAQPQKTAQQSNSPANKSNDILIPPDWDRGVVASQPAMLIPPPVSGAGQSPAELTIQPPAYSGSIASEVTGQRTASLAPNGNFLVPPAVEGSKVDVIPPAAAAEKDTPPKLTSPPMVPPKVGGIDLGNAPVPAPAATATRPNLPVFELAAPESGNDSEPEEDMDLLLSPAPVGTAPVAAAPQAIVPDAPSATDPLAGTFTDEAPAAAPKEAAAKSEKPYTGLTLEEDMFAAPVTKAARAPKEEEPVFQAPLPAPAPAPADEAPLNIAEESAPMLPPIPVAEKSPAAVTATAPAVEEPASKPAPLPGIPTTAKQPTVEAPQVSTTDVPNANASAKEAPKSEASRVEAPKAPDVAEAKPPAANDPNKSKLELIHARPGSGLKGFCAVALQNERELKDAREEYSALFHGRLYSFSSEQALETFLADPARYAPAARGNDVIHLALTGEEVEGSLDHAVWYQGRLYLFTSVETLETFTAAPSSHATNE